MSTKIDITDIFRDHFDTLRDNRNGKISLSDVFVFFCLPFLISLALLCNGVYITSQFATTLIACFSIFTALLFNLLLLVFDIADKVKTSSENKDVEKFYSVLKEIYINVSFCISISVVLIVVLSGFFININFGLYVKVLSFISYLISINFILTLLMILKRIYRLLTKKIANKW